MTSRTPAARAGRLFALIAACTGLHGAGIAEAAAPQGLKLTREPAARAAKLEAGATKVTYARLSAVGVSAGAAELSGRALTVRLRTRRTVELRLAVVQGRRITAFKTLTVARGAYRLTGRLNLTPRGSGLRLRVTGRIRTTRGRGFVPLTLKAPPNRAPVSLALAGATVAENRPAGTAAGTFTGLDPDFGDTPVYRLVPGAGDTDNAAFVVVGSALQTTVPLDFEAGGTRSVRARVADGHGGALERRFTIAVTDANDAPTALALSNAGVAENQPAGTIVGTLAGTDADAGTVFTYAFAAGAGDADNARFMLLGDSLRTAAGFDHETRPAYQVRLLVADGAGGSFAQPFTITVTDVDDAPTIATTAGALAYTENDPATVVDPGVGVGDADHAELASATVRITAGLEPTDALVFADTPRISGAYDGPAGRLTLTGVAPQADWQAALRSVRFRSSGDDPATAKTVAFSVGDGTLSSPEATRAITLTRVNDAPVLTTTPGPLGYAEADPPAAVDGGLTLTDPDGPITGASVQISAGHVAVEDELLFSPQLGISGSYDDPTGTLTLTGTAAAADYATALRTVRYRNGSSTPSLATRTVTFTAQDAASAAAPATRDIALSATDDAPDLTSAAGALAYTEGDAAAAIDPALTVADPDSAQLTGATVQLTTGYAGGGEDVLALPAQPVVSGSFSSATGTLTLTGTATLAAYQSALRAVTYENTSDDPHTTARTATFQASDATGAGAAGSHAITVTAVDDPPVAVADSATVAEDAAASALDVLVNDTDVDGGARSVASVTQPANGTVVITGGGTGLSYAPDADYCNTPPGTTPDGFTYTLAGGSAAAVTVAVSCADDPPVAVADSATVAEDSGATAVDVLANDTDVDGGPMSVASVTQPADGTVVITGGGTGLSFQPDANACGAASFTYTLNGAATATVSATVTCSPDSPVITTSGTALSYTENAAATPIDPALTASDPDPDAAITGASVAITGNFAAGQDVLTLGGSHPGITAAQVGATLALAGDATPAAYQAALRGVSYRNSSDAPSTLSRTVTFALTDETARSATATRAITVVAGNDAPSDIALSASTVAENEPSGTPVGTLSATDADPGDTATFTLVAGTGAADNAAFQVVGTQLQTATPLDLEAASSYSVRVRVTDGAAATFEKQLTITATDVNDAPTDISLTPAAVDEGLPVDTAVGTLTAADQDQPADSLTFTLVAGAGATDNAAFSISGSTLKTAAVLDHNAGATRSVRVAVADGRGGTFEKQLTVTVDNINLAPTDLSLAPTSVAENLPLLSTVGTFSATDPDVGDSFTYALVAGTGATDNAAFSISGSTLRTAAGYDFEARSSYAIRVQVSDGVATFEKPLTVTVTDANDAPTDIALSAASVAENQVSGTTIGTLSSTDQDAGATHTYTLVAGTGDADNARFQLSGTTLQTAQSLNFEATPSLSVRVRTTDDGGKTFERALTITVTDRNDAPVAADITLDAAKRAIGNTSLVGDDPTDGAPDPAGPQKTVTADLLAGADDEDGTGSLAVSAGTFATDDGGSVTLEADGDFTYLPRTGTGCSDHTDFFDYTVTDQNAVVPPGTPGTDVGRVSIDIQDCVWFVDGAAPAPPVATAGSSLTPLTALTSLNGAGGAGDPDGTGQTIFLYPGTYTGGLALEGTQRLLSRRHGLAVADGAGGAGLVTLEGADPAGSGSTVEGGVVLATGNTLQGIHLGTTGAAGVFALSGASVGTAKVNDATSGRIDNPAGGAISITGSANVLSFVLSELSSAGSSGSAVSLANASGSVTAPAGTITNATGADVALSGGSLDLTLGAAISDDLGQLISVSGQTGGVKDFDGAITDLNDGDGSGISLSSNPGATIRFDGGLTLATGANPAFAATGGGTLAVTDPVGSAVNTIATTTGTALNVANTTIGSDGLTFRSVAANGAVSGIVLNTTGGSGGLTVTGNGGTCSSAATCSGGAIQNAGGPGVALTSVGGGVSLTRMSVGPGAGDGILATTVGGGLQLIDSRVTGSGDAVGEHGLDLTNVTGGSQLTNTTVTGSAETNARIANTVAGTSTWAITGSTFSGNSTALGAHGLEIRPDGTASVSATITGSTFAANRDTAFLLANGGGSPTMNLRFTGNTVAGGNAALLSGQPGIVVAPTGGAQTKVEIANNPVSGTLGRAIILNPLPGSTAAAQFDATVTGNTIGDGTAFSGSAQGDGMVARANGNGDARFAIRSNTIRNYAQFGLWLRAQEGSGGTGSADFTVTGNTISNPSGVGYEGIYASAGATSGDNMVMCADIGGAGGANSFAGSGTAGLNDIGFSRRFATDLRLPGFVTGGDLSAYIAGRNTGGPTAANYDSELTGQPGPCTLPALPPA